MQITTQLCRKTKAENDSRLFKNSEGNRDGGWNVNLAREEGRLCFILASEVGIRTLERSEKSSKKTSRLLPKTGRSQATNLEIQTPPPSPTKKKKEKEMIEIHSSQITNHDPFGVQVNICFLRGPLGWLTEQEKPRIPSKFAKRAAWYNEFIFNVSNVQFPAPPLPLFPPLS